MMCQVSYLALGTADFEEQTEKIISVIRDSDLDHRVGSLATEVRGSQADLLALIQEIVAVAGSESRFVLDIRLSNTCGC
jgi:uncharacterized protein YqgV (UPF0045/DUF77 family)